MAGLSRSQKWDVQLQLKRKELEFFEEKNKGGDKVDRSYFTMVLIRLSDHAGFRLKEDDLTVMEFAMRKKDYVKHIEETKRLYNGRKR